MIPLPGGSSPFLFLPSKLRHPASQPVHSPPPTTPPAVVQTGCRPNRGHTTAFVSREDAKTRRETQWSSARGTNRPEMGRSRGHTTPFVSREDAKTRKETQWSSPRRTNPAGDSPERRGATGSGDTPHFNRGIPRHSAEAYHSTGIYPTTGTYHSTAVQHTCGAVDTPPRSSHAKTRRREEKRSGRRRGGQIRPEMGRSWGHTTRRPEQHLRQAHPGTTAGAGDIPLQRRVAGTHHTSIAASHTTLQKHTIQPVHTVQPAYTIQPLHNTLEPGETI